MLGISKKAENSFTVEELEEVCIKRGYLHRVKEWVKELIWVLGFGTQ